MKAHFRVNNQIRVFEVSVIDDEGNQLGVMKTIDALKMAQEKELDLVEVSPYQTPPITKIMDYGKFLYDHEKKTKKQGVKPKEQEIKIIRFGFKISKHDLEIRSKKADEFLEKGHKVGIELTLKGREKAFGEMAKEKLKNFLTLITQTFEIENDIKRQPSGLTVLIKAGKKI